VIELPCASSHAPELEAEHQVAVTLEDFRRPVQRLEMHRPAMQRVRVAEKRDSDGLGRRAHEYGFEWTGRAIQIEVLRAHELGYSA
jgi:hypothetical protein